MISGKAGEAAAETCAPVAFAAAATLVGLMTPDGANLDGTEGGVRKGTEIEQTGTTRSAPILALVDEDLQFVLLALIGHANEGNVNDHAVSIDRGINIDGNLIDDAVGKRHKGTFNVGLERGIIGRPRNGLGHKGLVELGREADGKGLAVKVGVDVVGIVQSNGLRLGDLIAMAGQTKSRRLVVSGDDIEDVIAVRAHPLSASDSGPAGVTDTGTSAVHVEGAAVKLLGTGAQARQLQGGAIVVLVVHDAVGQVLHVLARAMSGTVRGTGLSGARLALVAGEALALSSFAIAGALSGALDVLVVTAVGIGSIDPGQLKCTETVGTVSASLAVHALCVMGKDREGGDVVRKRIRGRFQEEEIGTRGTISGTYPAWITFARLVLAAFALPRAKAWTGSVGDSGEERDEGNCFEEHVVFACEEKKRENQGVQLERTLKLEIIVIIPSNHCIWHSIEAHRGQ